MPTLEAIEPRPKSSPAPVRENYLIWQEFFLRWPADLPQRGVLVTSENEQVPFSGFLASESLVVLERPAPDTVGGRKVVLSYHNIAAIKITDVVKEKAFAGFGFVGKFPQR